MISFMIITSIFILCKSIDEYYSTKDETSLRKYAGLLGLTVEEVLAWDDV